MKKRKRKNSLVSIDAEYFNAPVGSIAIKADVRVFDFEKLGSENQYDIILMDPPWQLATSMPTRGVALTYAQLSDNEISCMPIPKLQTSGLLFIWVINNKYMKALELFAKWDYKLIDEIVWVKHTKNRRLAKCHGYYLQHAKETCLVGAKGDIDSTFQRNLENDVIFTLREGQSEKPKELYRMIEAIKPNGKYLEIFGRRNNLRPGWTTIGNEL